MSEILPTISFMLECTAYVCLSSYMFFLYMFLCVMHVDVPVFCWIYALVSNSKFQMIMYNVIFYGVKGAIC